ncbi:hypothetical protein RHMOL_Rhmol02G0066900 [Rhododendron molle]|uniref:Uncharacterized protein n=1 Tax=Rhododendron molle TaxID=49168 RepID=A0ACC0PPV8_RHOML|nr:hypothetical protein RHMOL_Rhmol02G0066900 [Rhododendron molle]
MTPPSNRVTGHRRLNSSSNQDMDSMRGFGDSAHYGNMRLKFAYGGFMEGKERKHYNTGLVHLIIDMDLMRGFGDSAHYGNMHSKFAYGGFMGGKEALQYRDMDSMRGFGISAHDGNEEFDMRSKIAITGFVVGKKALKYRVESTCCFGGFVQGKEASECMGLLSHVGKWKRLHPKRVIILSLLKDRTLGGEKLPKWVKPRGPYRALTFQEKEYYRKRAEESRAAKYQFAKLIKANHRSGYPIEYFITFQAYDMACFRCKTFQANVAIGFKETAADCWPEPYPTSQRYFLSLLFFCFVVIGSLMGLYTVSPANCPDIISDAGAVECSSADQH